MDTKTYFLNQLDGIINQFDSLSARAIYDDLSDLQGTQEIAMLITKSKATIERIVGNNSEYYKSIQIAFDDNRSYPHNGWRIKHIIGVVHALKDDLSNDYLKSLSMLIHAEIFTDYMDMANYLLGEGYKDPAAVLAGSTLEGHLRKLCDMNSIETEFLNMKERRIPKKADTINNELFKANIYSKTFQKQITTWLDLRNNAAHGKYHEYQNEEVALMINGIMNFMMTHPA